MSKVSILIACYNVAKFIPLNIDYILKQTYSDIEIILVNDGSTDQSGELCDKIAASDPRVTIIHKENGGLASARNTGLDAAKGEYIYFCDIDDKIELDLIERMVNIANTNKSEIIIFGIDIYDIKAGTHDKNRFPDRIITDNNKLRSIFCEEIYFKKHGNGFVCNKFYNRNFIEKNKFRFGNESIQQDEPFNLELYKKAELVVLTSQSGYHYYINPNSSAGAKYIDKKFDAVNSVFESLRNFYYEWNVPENRFLNAVYKRYRNSILNVICHNYFHKDCPLTIKQKKERILEIYNNKNFRECKKHLKTSKDLDKISAFFWWCLKHQYIKLLIIVNLIYIKLKNTIKR